MGLDQYAFAVSKAQLPEEFDQLPENINKEELAYWRKHPNLQGWMQSLWRSKLEDDSDVSWNSFNCVAVELTETDLDELEKDIRSAVLPHTTGFFFGDDSDEYYREADLKFIASARQAIKEGKAVFYDSWW